MNKINLVGEKFGELEVVEERGINKSGNYQFLCHCKCGGVAIISSSNLRRGNSTTCGHVFRKHMFTKEQKRAIRTPEHKFYHRYQTIKDRCLNPNNVAYRNYGGRGIEFRWSGFEQFRDDMYESFLKHVSEFGWKDTTIEREDVDGHYEASNCRWATYKEQAANKRK